MEETANLIIETAAFHLGTYIPVDIFLLIIGELKPSDCVTGGRRIIERDPLDAWVDLHSGYCCKRVIDNSSL